MELFTVIASALVNGAVVLAVLRTELKYHRRDIDHAHKRLDRLEGVTHG